MCGVTFWRYSQRSFPNRVSATNGIHLFGASGSGVSTLGWHLGQAMAATYLDTDDFYWQPTNPPYTTKVPERERVLSVLNAIDGIESPRRWILGGSLCGWGDALIPRFDLAVFVYLPGDVRMQRLRDREMTRHGDRIRKGGDMYELHNEFLDWAQRYDTAGYEIRSLETHRRWAQMLRCPVLELKGPAPVEAWVGEVLAACQ